MIDHPIPKDSVETYNTDGSRNTLSYPLVPDYIGNDFFCLAANTGYYASMQNRDWVGSYVCCYYDGRGSAHENLTQSSCPVSYFGLLEVSTGQSRKGFYNAGGNTNE
ncbi:MAG: hypothetical protein ACLFQV_09285, partial [Vulcanimicrobiota bacterium]